MASGNTDSLKQRQQSVFYDAADSAEVVRLLGLPVRGSDVLFYARCFLGKPYVASTLETDGTERLVVNLKSFDCATLVETVCALALTKRQGSDSFAEFCDNLVRIRYRGGRIDGYLSRLHYFTWWMHDNIDAGLFREVSDERHFTTPMVVRNAYMSTHPSSYKALAAHPEWVDSIAAMEQRWNGADGTYLPASATALSKQKLRVVHDGDVVAIVTTKAGLDYSHLGFAVWGHDGWLHLLNASSVYHRVVEDKMPLREYLRKHRTSVGIRLLRLTGD